MNKQGSTIKQKLALATVFLVSLAVFAVISITITMFGIYMAYQLFFSVGWWAGVLVIIGVLVVFAASVAFVLEYIERKFDK
jgi:hypothetical protein